MTASARTRTERNRDTLRRLEHDVDAWVATADAGHGAPHLVPLSYLWDGETVLIATPTSGPTGRNLRATGVVRLGLGLTRDVILIDGPAEALAAADLPDGVGDAFAARTGFDPRELSTPYTYFRVRPLRIQAWREENELEGRELMRRGQWLPPD